MNDRNPRGLPPPPMRSSMGFGGALGLIFSWFAWIAMVMVGALFVLAVLFWVAVAILFSLVSGWITGRPSTVALLWRQYRDLMKRRWPHTPGARPSATPRADATPGSGRADGVEDVNWHDVPDDKPPR